MRREYPQNRRGHQRHATGATTFSSTVPISDGDLKPGLERRRRMAAGEDANRMKQRAEAVDAAE